MNGLRISIAASAGASSVDVTIPSGALSGGLGWKVNRTGTQWTYTDPHGTQSSVTRATLNNRSARTDGLLHLSVRAKGGSVVLPSTTGVHTTVVFGDSGECAQIDWNPPTAARPRCSGTATQLTCR